MASGCTRSPGTRSTSPSSASASPCSRWRPSRGGCSPDATGPRPARLRLDHARIRGAARRPGRAVRGRLRRLGRGALPDHAACRCSRSGSARGSRAERRARSRSCSRSGRSSSSARPRCRSRSSRRPRRCRTRRRRRPLAARIRGLGARRTRRRRARRRCARARGPAALRVGDRRRRRRRPRAPLGRLRPADRRRLGARGAGRDRVGAPRLARRRRAGRRHAARDRRPALDGDRPHDLLEPRHRRGRPARARHDPVPAGHGLRRDRPRRHARGRIRRAARAPLVVTPSTITLVGNKVAARPAGDSEAYGLAAWRPEQPVRVALRTEGFLPNGDFTGTARITVYACRQGTLDVTILGKTGDPIEARVDGVAVGGSTRRTARPRRIASPRRRTRTGRGPASSSSRTPATRARRRSPSPRVAPRRLSRAAGRPAR